MALLGFSEYTFMNWQRIQEPYVRSLLNQRALVTLAYALLIAAALSILFILVPGTMYGMFGLTTRQHGTPTWKTMRLTWISMLSSSHCKYHRHDSVAQ